MANFPISDAHVVICARRSGQPVATTDPADLRVLDAGLGMIALWRQALAGAGGRRISALQRRRASRRRSAMRASSSR
jgi:hypothetical protein